jgi:hypothetical protein
MFYAARDFGTATANRSRCSGASAEADTVQAEAPHCFDCSTNVRCLQWHASPWLKPTKNPPNRYRSSGAACGGFRSVKAGIKRRAKP